MPDTAPDSTVPRSSRAALLLAALTACVGFTAQLFIWPEGDVAWLLTIARRVADGAVLYSRDLIEVNPPLVMQLSGGAVHLARWFHIDTVLAWRLLVAALAAASLTLCWRLLRDTRPRRDATLDTSLAVLLAAALWCLPGIMFGQREHLIVLGFVPYILAAGLRADGVRVSGTRGVAIGAALAVAVSIKPHYSLSIVFVELALALRRRTWRGLFRAETISGAVVLALLQAATELQFPGYLAFAVPLALRYYPSYGVATVRVAYLLSLAFGVGGAAGTLVAGRRFPTGLALQSQMFALAGLGSFGGYLLQGQGWEYQFLPAQTFLILAGAIPALVAGLRVLGEYMRRAPAARQRTVPVAWLTLFLLAITALTVRRTVHINGHERSRTVTDVRRLVERSFPPDRPRTMASMTLSLFPASPVAELVGANWASRFSCLWLLPGITAHEQAARSGTEPPMDGRAYLESAVVEDFERWRPTLVVVERNTPRVLDEVLKSSAFQAEWQHYRSAGVTDTVEVFVRDTP